MTEIAIAVTVTAREHGYDVLLLTNDEGAEGVRRVAASGLADGVILMDVTLDDDRIRVLRTLDTPAALIGLPENPAGLSCVDNDFALAGALCADHLADLGHRDVAFVGYGSGVYRRHAGYAERTLTGFRERAERRGLRFLHRPCEGTYESTAGTLSRILADRPDTTGFVVQNEAAIGPLLSLLRAGGRIVPEDASVVAICPEPLADQHSPRLTSVTGPQKELGRAAVAQVLARITAVAGGRRAGGRTAPDGTGTGRPRKHRSGPAPELPPLTHDQRDRSTCRCAGSPIGSTASRSAGTTTRSSGTRRCGRRTTN